MKEVEKVHNKSEIRKSDELIFKFMEYEYCRILFAWGSEPGFTIPSIGDVGLFTAEFSYNWNWLMMVAEKIEDMVFDLDKYGVCMVQISTHKHTCHIEIFPIKSNQEIFSFGGSSDTKINAVYLAVIGFIKWYNSANILSESTYISKNDIDASEDINKPLNINDNTIELENFYFDEYLPMEKSGFLYRVYNFFTLKWINGGVK